jgi:small-conductance mechanosensitive channel
MKTEALLHSLLLDLWIDLHDPAVFWQLAVLGVCLAFAAWRGRKAVHRLQSVGAGARPAGPEGATAADSRGPADAQPAAGASPGPRSSRLGGLPWQHAHEAAVRLLFPLIALVLVLVARPILGLWQNTHLLRLAAVLLATMALARTIVYAVSRLSRTPALVAFERVLVAFVWGAMVLYVTGYWIELVDLLESIVIPVGKQRVSVWTILSSSFWVMVTLLAALWLGGFLEARLLASTAIDSSLRAVLSRLMRGLLLTMGVLIGLSLVGLDITALSVFGGALGVGIGLGLQKIASNYISGFIVLLERTVRIGDMIKVDQYAGQVREIRTRFTVLRGLDGIEHIIPNEVLTGQPVQNFSTAGSLRLKVALQVAYGTDLAQASRLAIAAAQTVPRVLATPPPSVLLSQFAADGLGLDLTFSIADPDKGQGNVCSDVSLAVWDQYRQAGITVPFPQREIRILDGRAADPGLPAGGATPKSNPISGPSS